MYRWNFFSVDLPVLSEAPKIEVRDSNSVFLKWKKWEQNTHQQNPFGTSIDKYEIYSIEGEKGKPTFIGQTSLYGNKTNPLLNVILI